MDRMTAADASHLVAPGAVTAEARPEAAADDPCPASARSAFDECALADGAATTLNMDYCGRHSVSRQLLVTTNGWLLTIVYWLGRSHVHWWLSMVDHRCIMMHRRDVVSGWFVMYRGLIVMRVSVMCHSVFI